MKKLIHAAAAAALAFSMQAGVTTASAEDGKSDIAELCKAAVDAGRYESVGDCMGTINKRVPQFCRDNWDNPRFARYGWKNQGDCVAYIQERRNQ